jgi:hypothetical protein
MPKSFIEFSRQSDASSSARGGARRVRRSGEPCGTKPLSPRREVVRKQKPHMLHPDQRRGSIMLIRILNAIYRQFLRAALIGTAAMGGRP